MKMKTSVKHYRVTIENADQRIDNFIISYFKGMPKTRVYRLLRKGEIRVNKKRIVASYRLCEGDDVRLPPVYLEETAKLAPPSQTTQTLLSERILYEDEDLIVLNKPSGMSVHLGSTVRIGVIEALRHMYPKFPNMELAHRLDAETSGCLVIAKRKSILRELHALLREGKVQKIYWALTLGKWKDSELRVDVPLHKDYQDGTKHVVEVNSKGKEALTVFHTIKSFKREASLMEVKLMTGRTHQIRVHAEHRGHPIAGDDRYGDVEFNKLVHQLGLHRMFLHARAIDFTLPSKDKHIKVEAPLDPELKAIVKVFEERYLNV